MDKKIFKIVPQKTMRERFMKATGPEWRDHEFMIHGTYIGWWILCQAIQVAMQDPDFKETEEGKAAMAFGESTLQVIANDPALREIADRGWNGEFFYNGML